MVGQKVHQHLFFPGRKTYTFETTRKLSQKQIQIYFCQVASTNLHCPVHQKKNSLLPSYTVHWRSEVVSKRMSFFRHPARGEMMSQRSLSPRASARWRSCVLSEVKWLIGRSRKPHAHYFRVTFSPDPASVLGPDWQEGDLRNRCGCLNFHT